MAIDDTNIESINQDRRHYESIKMHEHQNEILKRQTRFNEILAIGVIVTAIYYTMKMFETAFRNKVLFTESNIYVSYLLISIMLFFLTGLAIRIYILSKK